MQLKDFVFVTCLTPRASLSPLRAELFELYKSSLLKQSSSNWSAILMGEENRTEGNFIYLKAESTTKEDKLLELYHILDKLSVKPKYLIRLDDDDVISPVILQKIESEKLDFDVFVDKYQCMFNVYDLRSLSKEFAWFPSTVIMRFEDAMTKISYFRDLPLFVCDHDLVFHKFYHGRKVFYSKRYQPLYLRIFSPTSLSFSDSNKEFEQYCKRFGVWKYFSFEGYEGVLTHLEQINKKYFNTKTPVKFLFNVTADLKSLLGRVIRKFS